MNLFEPGISAPVVPAAAVWHPDLANGAYRNPVLFADYSDPDAIRVGKDFWMTSSSFCHVPGLPILHSRDLVNWTLVNHALPRLVPENHFARPRHGEGVWAPSLRHHGGKFWIFYPDPDFGIYQITAVDPRGAWSAPVLVKSGKGLIDPCPFWDDDGAAYLIHGWAKSRAGVSNQLTLHRLAADGRSVIDAGTIVVDGDLLPGWHTIEGPKLYKRSGYYYIFAPAGGVAEGYQAVFRSRALLGPYENRIVLEQGGTAINGPHQGAWVETEEGEDWFLHFQEVAAYGRVVHLQPMQWGQDGWPTIGNAGKPVLVHRKASLAPSAKSTPPIPTSDDFRAPRLGVQWQWQANPPAEWGTLLPERGTLRLRCAALKRGETLWNTPRLLMQKFPGPEFVVTTSLAFYPVVDGDAAGLIVFGCDYAWLGLRRKKSAVLLVLAICSDAHANGRERELVALQVAPGDLKLRVTVARGGKCQFAYSANEAAFIPIGPVFQARSSKWVGAKTGVFGANFLAPKAGGHADFIGFDVAPIAAEI
jgi:beta-xylosidase